MTRDSHFSRFRHAARFFAVLALFHCGVSFAQAVTPNVMDKFPTTATSATIDSPKPIDELIVVGTYDLTWFAIDVYRVQLLAKQMPFIFNPDGVDVPFELRIHYQIDIPSKKLVDETREQWKALKLDRPQSENWLNDLSIMWPNLKEGDELILSVSEDGVARFFFNKTYIGEIADPLFGSTFAAIWLHEKAEYPKMRAALLSAARLSKMP